ncbi:MAG: methyltransferase domain-containing protein [Azospirillaceae bacterium]
MTTSMPTADTIRAYFDDRSESWNEERSLYYSESIRDEVLKLGHFGADDQVLDFGAGAGFLTDALVSAGVGRVVAVDISTAMLDGIARRHGSAAVETRLAVDDRLPVGDGEVSGVVTNMVLHHLEDPLAFLREARRALAPQGRLVITDMLRHDNLEFARAQHDVWPGFDRLVLEDWLREAGFTDGRTGLVGEKCCGSVAAASGGFEILYAVATR